MTTRVASYYRISADAQGLREGVDRQRADCRERVLRERWTLREADEFEENDISASTNSKKKRPKYDEMIKRAEAGEYDVILAYSNSRLTRRPMELEGLITLHQRTGVRLCTVVSGDDNLGTADGRQNARIRASIDAGEAERTSERARRAKRAKKARGEYAGGARRFGFGQPHEVINADGRVILSAKNPNEVNEEEASLIRQGAEAVINDLGVRHVERLWNASGVKGVRGGAWHRGQIKSTLLDAGNVPAILDETTYSRVKAIMGDHTRSYSRGNTAKHWLSGVIECGICHDGSRFTYYRKVNQPRAYRRVNKHNAIMGHIAEKAVSVALSRWYYLGREAGPAVRGGKGRTISEVQIDRAALLTERDAVEQDINDRIATRTGSRTRLIEIRDALDVLDSELDQIRQADAHEALTEAAAFADVELRAIVQSAQVKRFVDPKYPWVAAIAVRERWENLQVKAKKELLFASFRVVVQPGRGEKRVHVCRDGHNLTSTELLPGEDASALTWINVPRMFLPAKD